LFTLIQTQYKDSYSPLKAFKRLAELRARDVVFQQGDFAFEKDGMFIYSRFLPNNPQENVSVKTLIILTLLQRNYRMLIVKVYILAVNWPVDGKETTQKLHISQAMARGKSVTKVEVKVPSAGNKAYHQNQDFNLEKEELLVEPYQAIVVRLM
jgi:hypothetical protein